ncbi:MAG: hypothetical protein H6767_00100 [Candidatus Peribacteria bacterium]|nr:MAG: hypothetical protein H6767_00100 [Candidatus Peribacteria bacterium]
MGKEDGLLVVYVDGQEVYRNESMVYRETDDLVVDSVLFSTFFGGSDPTWATPVDTKTYFKNFVVEW